MKSKDSLESEDISASVLSNYITHIEGFIKNLNTSPYSKSDVGGK